jgi:hypothetical protein
MPEIGTSGSMSGDGKRSVAAWPKLPRPSSTLPGLSRRIVCFHGEFGNRTIRGHYKTSADGPKPILPTHFEL